MTDIIERLRAPAGELTQIVERQEAANEIARLRKEKADLVDMVVIRQDGIERLRKVLQQIADMPATLEAKIDTARRALEPKP